MNKLKPYKSILDKGLFLVLSFLLFSFVAKAEDKSDKKEQVLTQPNKLSVKDQRKFDYIFLEGIKLKNSSNYDAAFDAFNYCLSIDSASAPLLYELSTFYLQLGRPEVAIDYLKKAVTHDSTNFTYGFALGGLSRQMGMFDEAATEFELLAKRNPQKPEINYYLAEIYAQKGDAEKAVKALNVVENDLGMSEALSMQKFRLYNSINKPDSAFAEIEKLANKYPMEARYRLVLGDLYLEKKDTTNAFIEYTKAHDIDPSDPYYIVAMANYYEETNNKEKAEAQIRSALLNEKLDAETKVGILSRYILSLHQSKKETEGADALFKTLLEQNPHEPEIILMYGTFLQSQGKLEEAKYQYKLVTELKPDDQKAWVQLLALTLKNENPDEIIAICNDAIQIFPQAPEFYFYLGIAYYQKEDYQKALETYQKGIKDMDQKNYPVLSDFYGQIGDIYYQMGNMDSTFAAYDNALKYNENNVVVLNNYSYFLTLDNRDLARAERMSGQCIKLEPDNSTYLDTYAWVFFRLKKYTLAKLYIQQALDKGGENSSEIVEHYGDILFMLGEKYAAVKQWEKSKELGKESKTLDEKIAKGEYIEEPKETPGTKQ